MSDQVRAILLLALLAGAGVWSAWGALGKWQEALSSKDWPTTQGEVIRAEVVQRMVYDRHSQRRVPSYSAQVTYAYEVRGRRFENDNVSTKVWPSSRREGWVDRHLRDYPVGKQVIVSYQPDNPGNAYLETGHVGTAVLLTLVACLCLFVPSMVIIMKRSSNLPW